MKPKFKSARKTSKVSDRISDSVAWGPEPKWTDEPLDARDARIGRAFNWYNSMSTSADQMKWALEYLNLHSESFGNDFIKKVSKLRDIEIYPAGSIFRMAMRGAKMPYNMISYGQVLLQRRTQLVHTHSQDADNRPKPKLPKLPELVEQTVENAITVVDTTLKRIQNKKLKAITDGEMAWASKLTAPQAKLIATEFQHSLAEFKEATVGKDQQLVEAYSHYSKPQMLLAIEFLEKVTTIKGTAVVQPVKAKPAKKVLPDIVVKKVLYQPNDPENNVTSIDPEYLVGAKELWVWNSRTSRLGMYVASNGEGLTVHRTTMLQYNADVSVMKVLRKPKVMLAQFQKLPDNKLKSFFEKLTTVAKPMNDRLNRDIVLLRAIRG